MALRTPERLGDYELVERLGVGGMAETFVAIRRGIGGFEQRVCRRSYIMGTSRACSSLVSPMALITSPSS